jgi:hypothetical protein
LENNHGDEYWEINESQNGLNAAPANVWVGWVFFKQKDADHKGQFVNDQEWHYPPFEQRHHRAA